MKKKDPELARKNRETFKTDQARKKEERKKIPPKVVIASPKRHIGRKPA
jgi:hypothetical protein